jgi:methyl-accepting chemotaxis protein
MATTRTSDRTPTPASLARRFRDLPIMVRLVIGFGAVSLVLVGTNVQNLRTMGALDRSSGRVYDESTKHVEAISRVQTNFSLSWIGLLMNISGFTSQDKTAGKDLYTTSYAETQTQLDVLAAADNVDDATRATLADIDEKLTAFDATVTGEIIPASMTGRTKEAYEVLTEVGSPVAVEADTMLKQLFEQEIAEGARIIDAADAEYSSQRNRTIVFLLAGVALAMAIGVWLARGISRPVQRTAAQLGRVADGDLTVELSFEQNDEVGAMAQSLTTALDRLRGSMNDIRSNAQSLSVASEELSTISDQMSTGAGETSSQATLVSAAAEEVSVNVSTVATAAEELSASITEISRSATKATQVASQAVELAHTTTGAMSKLEESSAEIGNVVRVISSIAEQTNLLALNATIEAARAGESGKGFAVVATEVKELAQQTSKATSDISSMIEEIQGDTRRAVEVIGQITEIIDQINQIQTSIAGAVEQQAVTTSEIGRTVNEAAMGTQEIASNITSVASAAEQTAAGAASSMDASRSLARMASELDSLVMQWRVDPQHASAELVEQRC